MKKTEMNNKNEGIFSIIAALTVLFTALLDPIISVVIAIVLLVGFAVFNLVKK